MNYKSSGNIWTSITAISAAVAALAALFSIMITWSNVRKQDERKRPYIKIAEPVPGIKQKTGEHPFTVDFTLENIGEHPAQDISCKQIMISSDFKNSPQICDVTIANEIPPGLSFWWSVPLDTIPMDFPVQYIVFMVKYNDSILNKSYSQAFYLKWLGAKEGVTHADFRNATMEDREIIDNYLRYFKLEP